MFYYQKELLNIIKSLQDRGLNRVFYDKTKSKSNLELTLWNLGL